MRWVQECGWGGGIVIHEVGPGVWAGGGAL